MTAATDQQGLIDQQDQLRSLRLFNSFMAGVTGDQAYSGTDGYAVNPSGQFVATGPYGAAVEGQPIVSYSNTGGITLAPVLLIAAGLAVAYFAFN